MKKNFDYPTREVEKNGCTVIEIDLGYTKYYYSSKDGILTDYNSVYVTDVNKENVADAIEMIENISNIYGVINCSLQELSQVKLI